MGLNLTALVAQAVEIESTLLIGGYEREAAEFRYQWNHYDTRYLESVIDSFLPIAVAAITQPRRGVISPCISAGMFEVEAYVACAAVSERERREID